MPYCSCGGEEKVKPFEYNPQKIFLGVVFMFSAVLRGYTVEIDSEM